MGRPSLAWVYGSFLLGSAFDGFSGETSTRPQRQAKNAFRMKSIRIRGCGRLQCDPDRYEGH
jgi:hypothetical protein